MIIRIDHTFVGHLYWYTTDLSAQLQGKYVGNRITLMNIDMKTTYLYEKNETLFLFITYY